MSTHANVLLQEVPLNIYRLRIRTFKSKAVKWFPEGCLPECPSNFNDKDILRYSLQPGDVVAFHFLAVHGAPGVYSNIYKYPSICMYYDTAYTIQE